MKKCHRCAKPWRESEPPGFNNTCDGCGMGLHSCANCEHYRPQGSSRCALPNTERILDAAASNRCGAFVFQDEIGAEQKNAAAGEKIRQILTSDRNEATRNKTWEELFG